MSKTESTEIRPGDRIFYPSDSEQAGTVCYVELYIGGSRITAHLDFGGIISAPGEHFKFYERRI